MKALLTSLIILFAACSTPSNTGRRVAVCDSLCASWINAARYEVHPTEEQAPSIQGAPLLAQDVVVIAAGHDRMLHGQGDTPSWLASLVKPVVESGARCVVVQLPEECPELHGLVELDVEGHRAEMVKLAGVMGCALIDPPWSVEGCRDTYDDHWTPGAALLEELAPLVDAALEDD